MRSTAKIEKLALVIHRNDGVLRQIADQLQLQIIIQLCEDFKCLVTADDSAADVQILLDDLIHLLLDLHQILRSQGLLHIYIIIESIFNNRADSKLHIRFAIQPFNRLCKQMSRTVAVYLKPVS
ncbi:hypothetical protein D3C71_1750280 [compost metagenome]